MKSALTAALIAWCVIAHGQTYTRYAVTNFVANGGNYVATTNITVGANMSAMVSALWATTNLDYLGGGGFVWKVQYPESSQWCYLWGNTSSGTPSTVVGPCTIQLVCTSINNNSPTAFFILQTAPVNVSPAPIGVVQPLSQTVTVALQSSTDLTSWSTATNGVYGGTDSYRFFRVNLRQ